MVKREMYVYKNMISSVIHLKLFLIYNLQLFIFKNKKNLWALAGRRNTAEGPPVGQLWCRLFSDVLLTATII
jgi:hypothetical protein